MLGITDRGKLIDVTSGTFTQTLDSAGTLGSGWFLDYKNSGTGLITVDPAGTETIGGSSTLLIGSGEVYRIQCDGSNFNLIPLNVDKGPHFVATESVVPSPASRVTRLLNTVERNFYGWSFSSNQLTLPAGEYTVWATCGGSGISNNYPVLRNVTDSVDIVTGVAGFANDVGAYAFWAAGFIPSMTFTLTSQKVVRLDHLMTTSANSSLDVGPQKGAVMSIWKRT